MRILTLQFRNLNSLQGDHRISFQEPPLSTTGLFAITGPTGAGKTTILDAITLALYGRAARYDRAVPSEIMSRHTGDCFAEVEFESQGQRYGARWELRRARGKADGTLQGAKRRVYDLANAATIVDKVKEVDEWIEEHTGLDYQRFLRSVLLAQGDFTAFLKASNKERGHLLEKLTGMEIYAELSQLAYEVAKEKRLAVEALSVRTKGIELLSPEDRETRSLALTQLQSTLKSTEKKISTHRSVHATLESWHRLAEKRRAHAESLKSLEAEVAAAAPWQARLALHRKVEPQGESILKFRSLTQQIASSEAERQVLRRQGGLLEKEVTKAKAEAREAEKQLQQRQGNLKELGVLIEKVIPLDRELAFRQEQLTATEERLTSEGQTKKALEAELQAKTAQEQKTNKQLQAVTQWLEQHASDAALEEALPTWHRTFDRLQQIVEQQTQTAKRQREHDSKLANLQAQNQEHTQQQQALEVQLEKAAARVGTISKILNDQLEGKTPASRESASRKLTERRIVYHAILTKSQQHEERAARIKTLTQSLIDQRKALAKLTEDLASGEQARKAAETSYHLHRELVQRGQEIHKLREALRDGAPCAVCGATEHPWESKAGAVAEAEDLRAAEKALEDVRKAQERRRSEETRLKTRLAQAEEERSEHSKAMASLAEEVALQQADEAAALACEDLDGIRSRLAEIEKAQMLEDQQAKAIRKTQQELESARRDYEQCKAESQKLAQALANLQGQQKAMVMQAAQDKEILATSTRQCEETLSRLRTTLPGEAKQLESVSDIAQFLKSADERSKSYLNQRRESDRLSNAQKELSSVISALQTRLVDAKKAMEETQGHVAKGKSLLKSLAEQREALAGKRDILAERDAAENALVKANESHETRNLQHQQAQQRLDETQTLLSKTEQQVGGFQKERQALQSTLQSVAESLSLESIESLLAAHLPTAEAQKFSHEDQKLRAQQIRIQTEGAEHENEAKRLQTAYRALCPEGANMDAIDLGPWTAAFREQESQFEVLKREVWSAEQVLKQDADKRQEIASALKTLAEAEKDLARWQELDRLIGSADGSVFSRFAQTLTLKRLVDFANRHLEKLTDRYRIQSHPDKELEIEVVDRYQANAIRSMQSLSGGESFLASLALALGLAELAGGRGRIESLFIDEGFGTLDGDTLEVAIRALECLQAQHKTIGVISHTEILKERISCQIQVSRGQGGVSTLAVVER